jgi:amino acid permease
MYCYKQDVSGIKAAAFWGVLGIISFLIVILVDLLYSSWMETIYMDKSLNFRNITLNDDFISCIACIILSFSFHTYTFSIYECLHKPSRKKMLISSSIGIFISTLIYLLVGCIGYILYGSNIKDSILDTMNSSTLIIIESICFVINVVMSFPLTFTSLRHYFIFLLQIIITAIRDSYCKRKINTTKLLDGHNTNNPTLVDETNSANPFKKAKELKVEYIHEDNSCAREDNSRAEDEEEDDHGHNMSGYIEIPPVIEYIIIFLVFGLIFYVAINYQEMKKV